MPQVHGVVSPSTKSLKVCLSVTNRHPSSAVTSPVKMPDVFTHLITTKCSLTMLELALAIVVRSFPLHSSPVWIHSLPQNQTF